MRYWLFFLSGLLLCAGCLDQSRDPKTLNSVIRPADPNAAQLSAAEEQMAIIDQELLRSASMPPAERMRHELALEASLERAVEVSTGTRLENKAVFYFANWRYSYRDGEGVDPLLNRLNGLASPAMKASGQRLRVLLLLRQGKVPEARTMGQSLVAEVPEFSPLMERVTFHETMGSAAPKVVSRNLSGGPDEPVSKRSEPWLLYLFVDVLDEASLFLLNRYLTALDVLPVDQRRVVCVTFESNLLSATSRLRSFPRGKEIDLLWASPGENGNAKEWATTWKLPTQNPHIALLGPGPDRTIMAVEVTPDNLRTLLMPTKTQ